jgi:thioredoxin reductase
MGDCTEDYHKAEYNIQRVENLIIGAGPAGLQLAYYFNKHNIPYLIIEKENKCGAFFEKFPHTRELLSINKRFTGSNNSDFNLRHDWNSLLNDENFVFTQYSTEFYPRAEDFMLYLNDFKDKFQINVCYNTTAKKISKLSSNTDDNYKVCTNKLTYVCKNLIMEGGCSKPNITIPNLPNGIKHYSEFNKNHFLNMNNLKQFENTSLLIVGGGNAGYELANHLTNYCKTIHIMESYQKNYSIRTIYAGHLRSKYYAFFDTFYLNSLNAITKIDTQSVKPAITISKHISGKFVTQIPYTDYDAFGSTKLNQYDDVIMCTGTKFDDSLFDFKLKLNNNDKYPVMNNSFQSVDNNNLFFIGALMHGLDYRQSSGGFVHGYRHLINYFTKVNYNISFNVHHIKFTKNLKCYDELEEKILNRINNASSIYQMHGVLGDMFYFDEKDKQLVYIEDVYLNEVENMASKLNLLYFNVIYLKIRDQKEHSLHKIDEFNEFDPLFIHPEIKSFKLGDSNKFFRFITHKFPEDLLASFTQLKLKARLKSVLKGCNLIIK